MDYFHSFFFIFAFSNLLFIHSVVIASFTIDLIHRDSKFSPFYNKSATSGELLRDSALRSLSRVNHFISQSSIDANKIVSLVIPNGGDYLMKISIGTPPVERYAIADTGSDLMWFQCSPCPQCYQQDAPLFNPTASSTYANLACDTSPCPDLGQSNRSVCARPNNECIFGNAYGDNSITVGNLATETFTFDSSNGQTPSFPNTRFGCAHQTRGRFGERASGLVGLGGGSLSLISQLRDEIQQTFSYCLVPMRADLNSKLRFGKDAAISGNGVVSTPLLSQASERAYYSLNLEGASVGGRKLVINNKINAREGNIVIDSGTTLTMLESEFYNDLEAAVREAVGSSSVQDPTGIYSLCYNEFPELEIVFHFTGADVTLKPLNIFRKGSNNLVCMTIVPVTRNNLPPIFGNLAQINFQVEYDLANKLVSFAPADCSQF